MNECTGYSMNKQSQINECTGYSVNKQSQINELRVDGLAYSDHDEQDRRDDLHREVRRIFAVDVDVVYQHQVTPAGV